jgi:WD40-like Beta Propeller Repeat
MLVIAATATSVLAMNPATPVAAAPSGYDIATSLADGPINPATPTVSPDGLWALFLDGSGKLHSVPTAGGRDRLLEPNPVSYVISPDSSRVVYQDDIGLASQSVAGAPEVRLYTGTDTDAIAITGDGRNVTFRAPVTGSTSRFDLWSVSIDGGVPVRLNPTLTGTGTVEFGKSSPDGQTIVFRASLTGATFDVFKVPVAGGAATRLNDELPAGGRVENFIEFSPDGKYILFAGQATVAGREDLYSVGPDGVVHRLSTNAANYAFSYRFAVDNERAVLYAGLVLLSARLDGSGVTVVKAAAAGELFTGSIVLSPATGRIVYAVVAGMTVVRSVRDDGSDVRTLLSDVVGYTVTPDHRTVVARTLGAGNVQRAAIDGTTLASVVLPFAAEVIRVTDNSSTVVLNGGSNVWVADLTGAASYADIAPVSGFTDTAAVAASPDGRRVLVAQDRLVDGEYGLVSYGPSFADGEHNRFVPLTPARILDTRPDQQIGFTGSKPGPDAVVQLQVLGRGGVPNDADIKAVVLNVTAVDSTAGGFVTAWPAGKARPLASNLNVELAGQNRPNLVTVGVGTGGLVSLFTNGGTHLVADVAGYYTFAANSSDGRLFPLPPTRLVDTRTGARPAAGATVPVDIRGRGGVPLTGVSAVVLNVTAVNGTAKGFVTAWPSGVDRPLASSLNLERAGQTIPNQVIVPVGSDGRVNLYTDQGTHLVVDVAGWFTNGEEGTGNSGLFRVFANGSIRMLDTRPDTQVLWSGPKPEAGAVVPMTFSGLGDGTSAYAANVTMVAATGPGFVTAYPHSQARPTASNLNSDAVGRTIANHVTVATGRPELNVSLYTDAGTHLVADIIGVYRS